MKDNLTTVNSKEVEWIIPDGMLQPLLHSCYIIIICLEEEERSFQIDRAGFAARSAFSRAQIRKGPSFRGGRGGGRGRGRGRGGRSTGRSGETGKSKFNSSEQDASKHIGEEQAGEKRKRAIEPDGGPDVGTRGATVPTIAATKKAKTDES